jgi:histone H3/H4
MSTNKKTMNKSKYVQNDDNSSDEDNYKHESNQQDSNDSEEEQPTTKNVLSSKYTKPKSSVSVKKQSEDSEDSEQEEPVVKRKSKSEETEQAETKSVRKSKTRDENQEEEPKSVLKKQLKKDKEESELVKAVKDAVITTSKRSPGKRSGSKAMTSFQRGTNADFDALSDSMIRKMLKTKIDSSSGECVEIAKDILARIAQKILSSTTTNLSGDYISKYMSQFVNEETDLVDEAYLSPNSFVKFIAPLEAQYGVKCRRDAYYTLQSYAESFLLKLVALSGKIAENNRRSRINGSDLLTAYEIRTC